MSANKQEDRKGASNWREFFWNPRTHEVMGRTASSWGLILLFYLVFYLFLAGMFALTMYTMLLTLDDYKPTWQDRLTTPGMMIRPKGDQLEITFSPSDVQSWNGFVQNLDGFLSPYNDSQQVQMNDNCLPDKYFIQEDSGEVKNNPKRSCQFNRTMLEDCSGKTDRLYGYSQGQPCVLIKLNRVIGMFPGKDGQSPFVTCGAKSFSRSTVQGLRCRILRFIMRHTFSMGDRSGLQAGQMEDSDKIGPLAYFPSNASFNLMYYPYYGKKAQVNYTQPLVAVKFLNASLNTDINVECKVNSNTLAAGSERDKFAGRVSFKLRINK
ncbi:sodium/potassium-transporting ATPase subunit beta-2a isoform X2 [Nerophis ophidion]|uniref:sodium/potassium-transporting ATPase subunit beta-2a isoform X2 n=1 Tax=Nerophis ophidion TaxID=159077 RepID=UPI002ADF7803|nr:sodium/potassium-transporting ATPase subunit beta-2a isoform X2 [Nerophis ophidion]